MRLTRRDLRIDLRKRSAVTDSFLERLFSEPSLSGQVPQHVQFSPDGQRVSYLASAPNGIDRLNLYACAVDDRQVTLLLDATALEGAEVTRMTDAERAQRERRRAFSGGVTGYAWLPDSRRLLIVADGAAWVLDSASDGSDDSEELLRLTPAGTRQSDIRLSPSGECFAFVRNGDLYLRLVEGSDGDAERRITDDAGDGISNGIAEFIAQEEMHRFEGYWFSADDRWLVYTRVDERCVAETYRYEFTGMGLQAIAQRYPYAGASNAQVTLWCFDRHSGTRCEVAWSDAPDDYLARVHISPTGIWVQAQSRDQTRLSLKRYAFTGEWLDTPLVEQHETWVNLHDNLKFLPERDDFLWTSERDGYQHLYLYRNGTAVQLTSGSGRVNEIVHVDKAFALVLGWQATATEQHLFRIWYDGRDMQQLSEAPGWHGVVISSDARHWVDRLTNLMQPPGLDLRSLQDGLNVPLAPNALAEGHPYHAYLETHVVPQLGTLDAEDGQQMHFRLTLPVGFDSSKRYPVLVNVYGGPGVQRVRNEWAPLTLQLFARAGIAIFELDNRGSGNRAKAFEDPLHGRLGEVEVADQLKGVDYLRSLDWVDASRIGVFGHSYGGYLTLLCLARGSGVFRCGVSIAPVTDWRLYDSHYTERYLGTPDCNPEGYAASNAIDQVEGIEGALLVVHGMADDNVLFANSTMLFKALQDRHQRFEMMTYPGAKHSLQERDVAIHRYQLMLDFLRRELIG